LSLHDRLGRSMLTAVSMSARLGVPPSPVAGRVTISKSFGFSASHELRLLSTGHKCARNHGHNYVVTVTLTADRLNLHGFVTDFGDLAPFEGYLTSTFDHRFVNDQVDFHPTCELLAEHLGCWFIGHVESSIHGRLVSMTVSETQTSSATWHRGEA
jgi:6-pyruvoyltetrahydropterin/6-carboxytetrahydropterin synthase